MTDRILTRLLLALAFLFPLALPVSGAGQPFELRPQETAAAAPEGSVSTSDPSQPAVADHAESNSTAASPFPDDYEVIEPASWRVVRMVSPLSHGGTCEITLLRPLRWFEVMGVEAGEVIDMHMPEMGISGKAEVLTIEACPEHVGVSQPGARPVTGTFVSTNTPVVDLHIEDLEEPIGVTSSHPFWSLDRSDWIAAADLQVGERLRTFDGEALVEEITPRLEPETVYNIEVHRQHSYYVADAKLWVHNNCVVPDLGRKLDYLFGKVTSNPHNTARSAGLLSQLNRIGIFDTPGGRALVTQHLGTVLNNPQNIISSSGSKVTRESLLAGPNGFLKMESVWIGDRLITVFLFGG